MAIVPRIGAQQSLPKGSTAEASAQAALPIERAAPEKFRLPPTAREIPARRSSTTKRFRTKGQGRSRFAEVATGKPLHYRDESGKWRRTKAEFKSMGLDEVAGALPFAVRATRDGIAIGPRDGGGTGASADASAIVFLTRKRPSRSRKTITTAFAGNALTWDWVLSDTELKLVSRRVSRRRGVVEYVFPYRLDGGFPAFSVRGDGTLSNGILDFGRPFLLGGDAGSHDGYTAWEVRPSRSEIVLRVDDSTLPAAAFPYRIDPPVTKQGQAVANYYAQFPFAIYDEDWNDPSRALTKTPRPRRPICRRAIRRLACGFTTSVLKSTRRRRSSTSRSS